MEVKRYTVSYILYKMIEFRWLTPLSAIFQLYHGDQFQWWKKPERTTDHGQAIGKLYHLRLRVECTFFVYFIHKPNSSEADYINNHILNVFKYVFNIQLIIKL
jgi:hypothetical protein